MAKQITLVEAARRAGLAPKTLRDAVARGSLKATRAGRDWLTTERWLQAYLDARPERFKAQRDWRDPAQHAGDATEAGCAPF